MNVARRTVLIATTACGIAVQPIALAAQRQPAPSTATQTVNNDARLLARADSITLRDYCQTARTALAAPAVITALGANAPAAETSADVICRPDVATVTLRELLGDEPASLASVARIHADRYRDLGRTMFTAMESFRSLVRAEDVRPVLRTAIGDSANTALVRVTETANLLLVRGARDAALERLARYERKLGPTSARLNGFEVLLNYGAQRFVPGFRATPSRGPSPWEIVASYVPTYGTIADGRLQAVSASEFGLRRYLFGEQFGAPGWRGLLRPTYWSAGALVTSDRNGALVWPWQDRQRTGAYVSWGSVKLGYVNGRQGEWLLSRQLQLVPFVF